MDDKNKKIELEIKTIDESDPGRKIVQYIAYTLMFFGLCAISKKMFCMCSKTHKNK